MSRLPIRARLTAAFAVVMALVLAATSLFAYTRMRSSLDETIETSLRSRSDDVATQVRHSETSLGAQGTRLIESEEGFVQVLTGNGRWVDGTTKGRLPALRPAEARRAARAPLTLERKVAGV